MSDPIASQASDKFQHPTSRVHKLWQTDFTYFRAVGWGWYFLSTILDDHSRYIITSRLTTTMAAADVTDTLEDALEATRLSEARVGTNRDNSRTTGSGESKDNDETKNTHPAISRLDSRSNRQKSVS